MKLKFGVIGIGFWGKNHVRIYDQLPETELVAICDINPERVSAVAEEYGVNAYLDSEKLLKQEDLDALSICTWSTRLSAEATKALMAGKDVLIEKPMAASAQQAKKIVDLASKKKRRIMIGFIERFNPGVQRFKNTIEKGDIGTLVCATARRVTKWPDRIGDVGVLKDTAIHDIDIMRYIFSEDPVAIYAKAGNLKHGKFEDYVQIMLTFEGGKTAFLEANWLTPYKVRKLVATGSEAIMTLDYLTQEITIETAGLTLTPRYEWQEPLKMELQHFANCILEKEEPLTTGMDGLKALQIAEASLKSASKCEAIKLQ